MSLYHEVADILSTPVADGGNLRSRIYGRSDSKFPPAYLYALALETCKWSQVLKEVIDNSQLLQVERKLTPILSLLLVHDFLLSKDGINLPKQHGLRATIERHKARLGSELTRARLRRKLPSLEALRAHVEAEISSAATHPRWIRINDIKTSLDEQLETTFSGFEQVSTVQQVLGGAVKSIYIDSNIPGLVALPPTFEFLGTDAYKSGAIILQDKASCFPAYLLDPRLDDGDLIDACAAPGNKTTHLAAIVHSRGTSDGQVIHAFEKDGRRAKSLEKMVNLAGSDGFTVIHSAQDFLKVDPHGGGYEKIGALLLDPSCSGSGIVARDAMPELYLPEQVGASGKDQAELNSKKRKRTDDAEKPAAVLVDDDGQTTLVSSERDLQARLAALASFQLTLLLHAFEFPAAKKITYSTCSIHAEENEQVVLQALQSAAARERGWKILPRDRQVRGLRDWPVRGVVDACGGNEEVAEACIRTYADDGRGVMGFFVAGFVREAEADDDDGPYLRDEQGRIIRDEQGIPTFKATGLKALQLRADEGSVGASESDSDAMSDGSSDDDNDEDGPYARDAEGRIVRDSQGLPRLKSRLPTGTANEEEDQASDNGSWQGFTD